MANTTISIMLATSAVLTLVACSGSSSSSGTSSSNTGISNIATTRLFAEDVGTASAAFSSGKTLVAQDGSIRAIVSTVGNGESKIAENANLTIRSDGASGIILNINDRDYILTAIDRDINDDGTSYGYFSDDEDNNIYVSIFSNNGEILPFINGESNWFVRLFQYQLIQDVGTDAENEIFTAERGYTILGTETSSSAVGRFTSQVTYDGFSAGDIIAANQDSIWANRTNIRSDLNIEVNFANSTLTGELYNIEMEERVASVFGDTVFVDGKIMLTDGVINGAAFSGTAQTDEVFQNATQTNFATGTFQGNFFGSDAQEIGGTYNLSNQEFNAVGGFGGQSQTD